MFLNKKKNENIIEIIIKSKFPGKKEQKILIKSNKIYKYYFFSGVGFTVYTNDENNYLFICNNRNLINDFKREMESIFIKRSKNNLIITDETFYIQFESYLIDNKWNGRFKEYYKGEIYLNDDLNNNITYCQRDKIYDDWKHIVCKNFTISYIYIFDEDNNICYLGESVGRQLIKDNKEKTNLEIDGYSSSFFKESILSARGKNEKFKKENKICLIMIEFNPFKYYHLILKEEKIALISGKFLNLDDARKLI